MLILVGSGIFLYVYKNGASPINNNVNEQIDSTEPETPLPYANKKKYEESAYVTSTTSTGWEIKNVEGKTINIISGTDKNLKLTDVVRVGFDGYPDHVYSNFEDLHLTFSGTTTLHVIADMSRDPDFHVSSAMYLPVKLNGSEEKLPHISGGNPDIRFCILDSSIRDIEEYKQKYGSKAIDITITAIDVKGFDPSFKKSCTYSAVFNIDPIEDNKIDYPY